MKKSFRLHADLYKKAYLIRRAEQGIIDNYATDAMKTPMHMSMGAEAIAAGVCQALKKTDQVLGTYRSHALYLAKTGKVKDFFAEMYGKVSGIADGKAGSMHLSAPEDGHFMSSAVVTTAVPIATGVAYANKFKKNGAVTAVFFGDGATEGGAFWESLNFACLKKLPVIFVCEDNGLAVFTDLAVRHGYRSLKKIVEQFDCLAYESSSTDAEAIYDLTVKAIAEMKRTGKPAFMHLHYYRYLQHVGVKEDFDIGYRSKEGSYKWKKADPVEVLRKKLLSDGASEAAIKAMERTVDRNVEDAIAAAERARFPAKDKLYENVFYGGK